MHRAASRSSGPCRAVAPANGTDFPVSEEFCSIPDESRYIGCVGGGRMIASVSTVAYLGLEARGVEVQCNLVAGLPKFVVVETQDPYCADESAC